MSMTIADTRGGEMQGALRELVRLEETRIPALERELADIRKVINRAAGAISNATLYDPEGVRIDA